jgi:hypothetical protein
VAKSLEGNPGIPDVARLKDLERECAEAATQHGELTVRCVVIGDELWEKDYNKADVILERNDLAVRAGEMLARDAESAVTRERVNDDGRRWIHRLVKAGTGKIISWQPEFEPRRAARAAEGYKLEEAGPQFAAEPTFGLSNPPRKAYQYQEYPRMLYRGKKYTIVQNDDELKVHLAEGWSKEPKWNVLEIPFFRASQIVLRELCHKVETEIADSADKPKPRTAKSLRQSIDETDEQRSERRRAYMDPVLAVLEWNENQLIIESCVNSNDVVYNFFNGKTRKLHYINRQAIEGTIKNSLRKRNKNAEADAFILPN